MGWKSWIMMVMVTLTVRVNSQRRVVGDIREQSISQLADFDAREEKVFRWEARQHTYNGNIENIRKLYSSNLYFVFNYWKSRFSYLSVQSLQINIWGRLSHSMPYDLHFQASSNISNHRIKSCQTLLHLPGILCLIYHAWSWSHIVSDNDSSLEFDCVRTGF